MCQCCSDDFPEEFTIHVDTITIKMMFLIATDASIDPTPLHLRPVDTGGAGGL